MWTRTIKENKRQMTPITLEATEHRCMLAAIKVMPTHMKEHVRLDVAFFPPFPIKNS